MAETVKSEAQSPERTDAGIYAGVEKYTKEDEPQVNVAYDPATGGNTGAGEPPTSQEISASHKIGNDEKHGACEPESAAKRDKFDATGRDEVLDSILKVAPAPSKEHLLASYPGLFPELEKQSHPQKTEQVTTAVNAEQKPKEAEVDEHHQQRRGVKKILHALHLDKSDRKKEQEEKRLTEERKIESENVEDIETSEISTQTTDGDIVLSNKPSESDAHDGGAPSDPRQHDAIPLEVLNPEGAEKKAKEDELLATGGDLETLDPPKVEETKIPADRINRLVEADHLRKEAGLAIKSEELDPETFKVNFHTADGSDAPAR